VKLRANAGIANRSAGMSDIKVGKRLFHRRITGLIVFLLFFPEGR
jgi:hypothetical protein